MISAIYRMKADTVLTNRSRAIRAVKGDNGTRFIDVCVTVNGEQVRVTKGTTTINVRRPDGEEDSFPGEINEDGTVRVPINQWTIDVPGEVICSCTVASEGKRLTTTAFSVIAQE